MGFISRRQRTEAVRHPKQNTSAQAQALFRRSRTLTGSVSSRITAATEAAAQLRSPRLKEHDLRAHRRKISVILMISLSMTLISLGVLRLYTARITTKYTFPDAQLYLEYVNDYLNTHPLERLQPLLNANELTRYVNQKAPEVEAVVLQDSGFFTDTVTIKFRTAIARWQLHNATYYVDKSGVAFLRKPELEPSLSVKDESGLPLAMQQSVASTKTLGFIGKTVGELSNTVGPVKEVIIPPTSLKEINVVLEKYPFRIRLHSDREPIGQATDIRNALRFLDSKGVTPRYLDARLEGKAFYR